MKKILLIICALFLLAQPAIAGQNTLTFEWGQPGDISDLSGWALKVSDTSGGPYTDGLTYLRDILGNPIDIIDIPYSGTPGAVYEGDAVIVVPDGAETNLCFVVTAWDTEGNESGNSNEVCDDFDFLGPDNPVQFKIKVKTKP